MGFIDSTTDAQVPYFYNVVHAVGANCPNVRDDVKLVQYLLMSLYARLPPSERPSGDMAVTGYCGPVTIGWIAKFQRDVNKKFPNGVLIDMRIDRVRDHKTKGSISKTTYALLALNQWTMAYNPVAWAATPSLVPLEPANSVGPPTGDVVNQQPEVIVPASGGF